MNLSQSVSKSGLQDLKVKCLRLREPGEQESERPNGKLQIASARYRLK
jgi:hypothetical protein